MAEVISGCLGGASPRRARAAMRRLRPPCSAGVDGLTISRAPRSRSSPLAVLSAHHRERLASCAPRLRAGFGVIGTSMCAAVIAPNGGKWFYGGFTDLGGGIHTHQFSLHAIIREADGRCETTALTPAVLKATGFATVADLVHAIHRENYYIRAQLMHPILFQVAATGDPVAIRIVRDFSKELALTATTLIRRYRLTGTDVPVVASGSRFTRTGPLLFDGFREAVLAVAPKARVILADDPPVTGAARGALEAAGRKSPEVWRNIGKSVAAKGWVDRIWGERS
jgi:hypothetical protein